MGALTQEINDAKELVRCETVTPEQVMQLMKSSTQGLYRHRELFDQFCPVQIYVNCPPEEVFAYMQNIYSLTEWTYGVRDLKPTSTQGVYVGKDLLMPKTAIYVKVKANAEALVVDYHCAWDQGDELWMIYLNRIVPAQPTLQLPGSVIFWQNCRHPYYYKNPHTQLAPPGRPWVGELWSYFVAGHQLEIQNLKNILEYRYEHQLGFAIEPQS